MADLAALQHEKLVLEREHALIVASIHEVRQEARKESIEAASCRQGVPEAKIKAWREGIAKLQSELMEVQAKIASANKGLRQAKANHPLKTLSQLPRDVAIKEEPDGIKANGAAIQAPGDMKEGYALYLQFSVSSSSRTSIRGWLRSLRGMHTLLLTIIARCTARRPPRKTRQTLRRQLGERS